MMSPAVLYIKKMHVQKSRLDLHLYLASSLCRSENQLYCALKKNEQYVFFVDRLISQCAPLRLCQGYPSIASSTPESYSGPKKSHLEVKVFLLIFFKNIMTTICIKLLNADTSRRNKLRWRQSRTHPVGVWASAGESVWVQHHRNHIQAHSRWELDKKKKIFCVNRIIFESQDMWLKAVVRCSYKIFKNT